MKPIKVALLGIGTVGSGVFNVLRRNQAEISARVGRGIEIVLVADRNLAHAKSITGDAVEVIDDAFAAVSRPDIDVVVELIGGYTVAKELVLKAIENGKHVVTANKALLAVHGTEIFKAAQQKGVMVAFEAAVAGGIPIIKALREGLSANRIEWIAGIINGTTNFILSEMRDKGLDFADVLKEAQRLGYAEADPTFDIEGVDAAHKITLLSAIAFGTDVQFDKAYVEGITQLASVDIRYAEQLGYRIKLLGVTRRAAEGIELRVHPTLQTLDCQRRRRDECSSCAWRRCRHNPVLRQRRRQRTHRQCRHCRLGRCGASAHCRARAPRAALGLPAQRHANTPAPAPHERRSYQLLPALARGRPSRRAGTNHRHTGSGKHQH